VAQWEAPGDAGLPSDTDRDVVLELARRTDVVIESFGPDVASKLRVDYETLLAATPRLVHRPVAGMPSRGDGRDGRRRDCQHLIRRSEDRNQQLDRLRDSERRAFETHTLYTASMFGVQGMPRGRAWVRPDRVHEYPLRRRRDRDHRARNGSRAPVLPRGHRRRRRLPRVGCGPIYERPGVTVNGRPALARKLGESEGRPDDVLPRDALRLDWG
jgi:CoA-transferase family III